MIKDRSFVNANDCLDVTQSRALAMQARDLIARLQTRVDATRERLLRSQRQLERSRTALLDAGMSEPLGTITQRIHAFAGSVEELHFRLGVEVSTTADELQTLLLVAEELRSLADFCALLEDLPTPDFQIRTAGSTR
jgi:hypothetical protein